MYAVNLFFMSYVIFGIRLILEDWKHVLVVIKMDSCQIWGTVT